MAGLGLAALVLDAADVAAMIRNWSSIARIAWSLASSRRAFAR